MSGCAWRAPCIDLRVGHALGQLVRDNGRHAVGLGVVIGAGHELRAVLRGALVVAERRAANECEPAAGARNINALRILPVACRQLQVASHKLQQM